MCWALHISRPGREIPHIMPVLPHQSPPTRIYRNQRGKRRPRTRLTGAPSKAPSLPDRFYSRHTARHKRPNHPSAYPPDLRPRSRANHHRRTNRQRRPILIKQRPRHRISPLPTRSRVLPPQRQFRTPRLPAPCRLLRLRIQDNATPRPKLDLRRRFPRRARGCPDSPQCREPALPAQCAHDQGPARRPQRPHQRSRIPQMDVRLHKRGRGAVRAADQSRGYWTVLLLQEYI